jgi:hypothetical protein
MMFELTIAVELESTGVLYDTEMAVGHNSYFLTFYVYGENQ